MTKHFDDLKLVLVADMKNVKITFEDPDIELPTIYLDLIPREL